MTQVRTSFALIFLVSVVCILTLRADEVTPTETPLIPPASTIAEANARARLLHETIHGAIQIVHRDFFDEDNPGAIPSASLEDVFASLADSYQVELKWLIVETDVLNVDHQPADDFERAAVKALRKGEPQYTESQPDRYRFAGPIRLASQCLKCHVKQRLTTEDRIAGLLISMPLNISR